MDGVGQAEPFPALKGFDRVCLVPYLLRGLSFPIHPFLRGLLNFYGIQLHRLTPASILHMVGYIALWKMYVGIEPHFQLWRKYFCLVPQTRGEVVHEVGGAAVWKIAGQGYPAGTPKEDSEVWTS